MDTMLAGTAGSIDLLNYDSSGALADAGAGNGTAVVKDSAGTAIAGSPFTATHVSTGLYRITIPATQTTLDVYDVTWTMPDASTRATRFEIVGSYIFTIADFRAFDSELASTANYPSAGIRDIREVVEERFANAGGVSFTRRGRRETLDGTNRIYIHVNSQKLSKIVSVKIAGVVIDPTLAIPYDHGKVELNSSWWIWGYRNVEILYEHGWFPTPAPIVDAAKRYARQMIVKGAFDDMGRATSIQTELGLMRISQAQGGGKLGIPDVDAVIEDYGRRSTAMMA